MISECSYQNVQLLRLTRVFARRTRHFVKPRDCKRYRISKGSDQTDVQAQSVQAHPSLHTSFIVGFAMRRLMCDLFLQTITLSTLGKIFSRRHFEIFFSFFQENRICILCKLSPLHEMSNPIFFVIKKIINLSSAEFAQRVVIQKLRVRYLRAPSVVSLSKTLYPHNLVLVSTLECLRGHMTILWTNIILKSFPGDARFIHASLLLVK